MDLIHRNRFSLNIIFLFLTVSFLASSLYLITFLYTPLAKACEDAPAESYLNKSPDKNLAFIKSFLKSIFSEFSIRHVYAGCDGGGITGETTSDNGGQSSGSGDAGGGITSGDSGPGDPTDNQGGDTIVDGDSGYVPPGSDGSPVQTLTEAAFVGCNRENPLVRYNFTASWSTDTVKFEVWRKRQDLDNWTVIREVTAPASYLDQTLPANSYSAPYTEYFIRRVDSRWGNMDSNHLQINVQNCNAPTMSLNSTTNTGCNGSFPLVQVDFSASYSSQTARFEIWRKTQGITEYLVARETNSPGTFIDDRLGSDSYQGSYTEYFIRRIDPFFGNSDSNHLQLNVASCVSPAPTPPPGTGATPPPAPTPTPIPSPAPFYIYNPSSSCNGSSYLNLVWDKSANANLYILYRYRQGKDSDWREVFRHNGQLGGSSYLYSDKMEADDYSYLTYYFVNAYQSSTGQVQRSMLRSSPSSYSTDGLNPLNCSSPSAFMLSTPQPYCSGTNPRVNLVFDRSEFATYYEVYRNRQGKDGAESWVIISPPAAIPQFASSQYTFGDEGLESNDYNYPTYYFVRAVNQNTQAARNSTYRLDPTQYSTNPPINTLDCNLPQVNLGVDGLPATEIPYQLEYDRQATLSYTNDHVSYCDKLSIVEGRSPPTDPNWTGRVTGASARSGGPIKTIKHRNPPTSTATYTLSCTNLNLDPSIQTRQTQQVVRINVKPKTAPFIQTTGGDVHTQGKIVVPTQRPSP